MENFNKVLSFILGLVVVVVFVSVLSGRLNLGLKEKLTGQKVPSSTSPTPTPQSKKSPSGKQSKKQEQEQAKEPTTESKDIMTVTQDVSQPIDTLDVGSPSQQQIAQKGEATEIPQTGIGLGFIPLAFSSLGVGIYLRKSGKK